MDAWTDRFADSWRTVTTPTSASTPTDPRVLGAVVAAAPPSVTPEVLPAEAVPVQELGNDRSPTFFETARENVRVSSIDPRPFELTSGQQRDDRPYAPASPAREAPAARAGSPLPVVEDRPQPARDVGARVAGFNAWNIAGARAPTPARESPRPAVATPVDSEMLWSEYAAQPRLDSLLPAEAPVTAVEGAEPVERPEPEYIPERLSVSVHDDLGEWSLDVRRHAQAVDLLFRGGQELASTLTAARPDIESALASAGHSLGSFRHEGQSGRQDPPAQPPQTRPRAQARAETRTVHAGRIDRVA